MNLKAIGTTTLLTVPTIADQDLRVKLGVCRSVQWPARTFLGAACSWEVA